MRAVYNDSSIPEKEAKERYHFPENIMMENAAAALEASVLETLQKLAEAEKETKKRPKILIVCGGGNNGGDGLALARRLCGKVLKGHDVEPEVFVHLFKTPKTDGARLQLKMAECAGVEFTEDIDFLVKSAAVIVDCLFGTGFSGTPDKRARELIKKLNSSSAYKVACDIPSALLFQADETVTMGALKTVLFCDRAKECTGGIRTAELGISSRSFENCSPPDAWLIEEKDIHLPNRKDRAAHKGVYGHTAVFCGEKSGAAILAASAAMSFGSGLTSLIRSENQDSDLSQFKISPSLMISGTIPQKTTAVSIGPGFTGFSKSAAKELEQWFATRKSPAAVIDAGFLGAEEFPAMLARLNSFEGARIVLTPHLAELSAMLKAFRAEFPDDFDDIPEELCTTPALAENAEGKTVTGRLLNRLFPRTAVVMKSANTFIAEEGQLFIVADGSQNLAKGGSGDILAGMIAALLAQGYSTKDAVITACGHHAMTARTLGSESYSLTPEKLIAVI